MRQPVCGAAVDRWLIWFLAPPALPNVGVDVFNPPGDFLACVGARILPGSSLSHAYGDGCRRNRGLPRSTAAVLACNGGNRVPHCADRLGPVRLYGDSAAGFERS